VQVNTVLPPGTTVPIGWVPVGDPVRIFAPGQHEQIAAHLSDRVVDGNSPPPDD
jgi:hypothetical protein